MLLSGLLLSMLVVAELVAASWIAGPAMSGRSPERLEHPDCVIALRSGDGLFVRNLERAFGTAKTVRLLQRTVAAVTRRFPDAPNLVVGDLSYLGGGRMRPHRSHRDGHDVDLGYYFKDGKPRRWFTRATAKTLDVRRQWALIEALVATGEVEYIFVSYPLQAALHAWAKREGLSERTLGALFQWPRPWRQKAGIIRLEPGHHDHLHVRFKKD